MFSRWINTGIKAAERALRDGRIDEAFARLTEPSTRNNRQAMELIPDLGRLLLARARLAAQAGQYRDALLDLDRLASLDLQTVEAAALRGRVQEELDLRVGRHAAQDDAFNKASDDVRAGRLESGRLAIERLEDPRRRERLREELDIRVQRSDELIAQALDALDREDPLTAVRFWQEACTRHGRTQRTDELASQLVEPVAGLLDSALRGGRVDRMDTLLATAANLVRFSPRLAELEQHAELVRRAAQRLNAQDHAGARDALLRLRAVRSDASWVADALRGIEQILARHAELVASPLGLVSPRQDAPPRAANLAETAVAAPRPQVEKVSAPENGKLFGRPLLLLIDGTGSGLIAASNVLRIGRSGAAVDVALPADVNSHHADLIREGDDYFLIARGPAQVNHRGVSRTMLRDGDRIVLGGNAKMVFRKPSVKSDSAILMLGDRCRLPQDVSFIVLFKGTCLLGPQASCHIRTREGDARLVLFERSGEIFVRRAGRDGLPTGPADALPLAATREFGDIRLTLKTYDQAGCA
jgi:tetratricopeptide (TPR) repeat protein